MRTLAMQSLLLLTIFFVSPSAHGVRVIPGRACGTGTPVRPLKASAMPQDLASLSEVECGTLESDEEFKAVMERVEAFKCTKKDVAYCLNTDNFVFVTGGQDCSNPSQVRKVLELPSDSDQLECALVLDTVAGEILKDPLMQKKWCLEENINCDGVEGYYFLRRGFESGCGSASAPISAVEAKPAAGWTNVDCALIAEQLFETEMQRGCAPNLVTSSLRLIDEGTMSRQDGEDTCRNRHNMYLALPRKEEQFQAIKDLVGEGITFWVAARTGNGLCAGSSCTSTHFVFEDDGPAFDASNYSPWLGLKVDENTDCGQIYRRFTGVYYLDDTPCDGPLRRVVCMATDC